MASIYDKLAAKYGEQIAGQIQQQNVGYKSGPSFSERLAQQRADDFNSKLQQQDEKIAKTTEAYTKRRAPWRTDPELAAANNQLLAKHREAEQGMQENRPETDEEREKREKQERNRMLISGIGEAVNGVAGLVGGISGGYVYNPEDGTNSVDQTLTDIDAAKAERLARAQRYYQFANARNKAYEDFIKAREARAKGDINNRYNQARADRAEQQARDQAAIDQSTINRNNRSGSSRRSGSGSSADDPEKEPVITSYDGVRKYKFRTSKQYDNACNAADQYIPHVEPYYVADARTGELKPVGTPQQRAAKYAASADSKDNADFWKVIENYANTNSSQQRTTAPWMDNSGNQSGSQSATQSAPPSGSDDSEEGEL